MSTVGSQLTMSLSTRGNLFTTFSTNVSITLLNLGSGILTARLLGPQGKGELVAVILWPSMLAALGSLGLTEAIVYFSGKRPEKIPSIFANSVIAALVQSIILVALGYMLLPLILSSYSEQVVAAARIFLFFIPVNLLTLYQLSILQARMRLVSFNLLRISVSAIYLAGLVSLYALNQISILSFALALLASVALTCLLTTLVVWSAGWAKWAPDASLSRPMLSYGVKTHLGSISAMLNTRLDQMLMSILLVPTQLGLYAVALTVAGVVNLISSAFEMVAFPSVLNKGSQEEQRRLFARFFRFNLIFAGVLGAGLFFLTPWIIKLFFGPAFASSITACRILILAMVFTGFTMLLGAGLKAFNQPLALAYAELIGLAVMGISLALLLPGFQILGAAAALVLASLARFVFMMRFVQQKMHVSLQEVAVPSRHDLEAFVSLIGFGGGEKVVGVK